MCRFRREQFEELIWINNELSLRLVLIKVVHRGEVVLIALVVLVL